MAVLNNYSIFQLNSYEQNDDRLHIDLAIHIFKSQNQALIIHLKNFLIYLVSPLALEKILKSAVEEIAVIDEQSCQWLFKNSNCLLPEIDLIEITQQMTKIILEKRGFILGQDFLFQSNGKLCACYHVIQQLSANYYEELTEKQNKLFILMKKEFLLL